MSADRMQQVNELLRKTIADTIAREIELPLGVFVTIIRVETSRDLKHATVYVTVLPDGKRVSTLQFIERNTRLIRKIVGSRIRIKYTPDLHFRFDEGEIKAQHIYDLLNEKQKKSSSIIDSTSPTQP